MQQTTQATPPAERMAKHRAGVAARLDEIRRDLRALRADVEALVNGRLDSLVNEQQERPQ